MTTRTLAWIVAAAIVVLAAADAWLLATGQGGPKQVVELAVVAAAVLAALVAWAVKAIKSLRRRSGQPDRIDELDTRIDGLYESLDSATERISDAESRLDALEDADAGVSSPVAWMASVHTVDENGKLQWVYDLPPEDSKADAIDAAHGSLVARDCEGQTVHNPRITVQPVYD